MESSHRLSFNATPRSPIRISITTSIVIFSSVVIHVNKRLCFHLSWCPTLSLNMKWLSCLLFSPAVALVAVGGPLDLTLWRGFCHRKTEEHTTWLWPMQSQAQVSCCQNLQRVLYGQASCELKRSIKWHSEGLCSFSNVLLSTYLFLSCPYRVCGNPNTVMKPPSSYIL